MILGGVCSACRRLIDEHQLLHPKSLSTASAFWREGQNNSGKDVFSSLHRQKLYYISKQEMTLHLLHLTGTSMVVTLCYYPDLLTAMEPSGRGSGQKGSQG